MQLSMVERDVLDGRHGEALAGVLREQIAVGEFFGAERLVPITNAHFMGDREVFGQAGTDYLSRLVEAGLRVRVPTSRNAQSVDFEHPDLLSHAPELVEGERETRRLLRSLGIDAVNTCINYQSIYQPHVGEHVAWGDTGTVAYANSVLGARTNYESGTAGLAAALTGRTPAYGFHLDEHRRANSRVRITARLGDLADWGAVGALVGERCRGYWNVPCLEVPEDRTPTADELKHLGAALASYGSLAMFHLVGATPGAPDFATANGGRDLADEFVVTQEDVDAFMARDLPDGGEVDLVVFTAPQLSLHELTSIARLLDGRTVADSVQLVITTNAPMCAALKDQGDAETIVKAGGTVLSGTCWYLMDPAGQRKRFGWERLATNSAKLANIIRAHGYTPALRRTAECIDAAVTGKVAGR